MSMDLAEKKRQRPRQGSLLRPRPIGRDRVVFSRGRACRCYALACGRGTHGFARPLARPLRSGCMRNLLFGKLHALAGAAIGGFGVQIGRAFAKPLADNEAVLLCGGVHYDSKPGSFSVNMKTGVWSDFATGRQQRFSAPCSAYERLCKKIPRVRGTRNNSTQILPITCFDHADSKGVFGSKRAKLQASYYFQPLITNTFFCRVSAWSRPDITTSVKWIRSGTNAALSSRSCRSHKPGGGHPRALTCYCVRNLYVTIRATMLAKISKAGSDFRSQVELRAAG
jgi:hypothetical protein